MQFKTDQLTSEFWDWLVNCPGAVFSELQQIDDEDGHLILTIGVAIKREDKQ